MSDIDDAVDRSDQLEIRGLARRWASNARADDDDYDDCPDCDGEAVPRDALRAHNEHCDGFQHDVMDDGGGRCTFCGTMLPACPSCAGYKPGCRRPLDYLADSDREALFWWVRREMERETVRLRSDVPIESRITHPKTKRLGVVIERDGDSRRVLWHNGAGTARWAERTTLLRYGVRLPGGHSEALADHIGAALKGPFAKGDGGKATALAWALCEAAGWPT